MSELEKLLSTIAGILNRLDIPYCVTGGAAVAVWGRPRFTADIDIVVELEVESLAPLARALREALGANAYIDEAMMAKEQARRGEFNIIQPESGLKADFFVMDGRDAYKRQQLTRTVRKDIAGTSVAFLSPEDLILQKLLWYHESESTRHLEDAGSIVVIQGDALDRSYLAQWAEKLGVADELAAMAA